MVSKEAKYLLIWCLSRNASFRDGVSAIPNSHLFRTFAWPFIEAAASSPDVKLLDSSIEFGQISKYHSSVVRVAEDYRLPLNWGPEAIHKWAIDAVKGFAAAPSRLAPFDIEVSEPEDEPFIEVYIRIKKGILWKEVAPALENVKEIVEKYKQAKERRAVYHALWLAQRLTGRMWEDIADWHKKQFHVNREPDSIRKSAAKLAKSLGIDISGIRR